MTNSIFPGRRDPGGGRAARGGQRRTSRPLEWETQQTCWKERTLYRSENHSMRGAKTSPLASQGQAVPSVTQRRGAQVPHTVHRPAPSTSSCHKGLTGPGRGRGRPPLDHFSRSRWDLGPEQAGTGSQPPQALHDYLSTALLQCVSVNCSPLPHCSPNLEPRVTERLFHFPKLDCTPPSRFEVTLPNKTSVVHESSVTESKTGCLWAAGWVVSEK